MAGTSPAMTNPFAFFETPRRRGSLFLIPPPCGIETSECSLLGWLAEGQSGGVVTAHSVSPPPVTSFAPLTMFHPSPRVGGIRKSSAVFIPPLLWGGWREAPGGVVTAHLS